MLKYILIILFCPCIKILSQHSEIVKIGTVSYLSSQLVYIKFEETEGIEIGDTLFIIQDNLKKPALIVNFKSTTSLACKRVDQFDIKPGDNLFAYVRKTISDKTFIDSTIVNNSHTQTTFPPHSEISITRNNQFQKADDYNLYGRYSMQVHSSLSNYYNRENYFNFRHSLNLDYGRMEKSKFSFSTYTIINHNNRDRISTSKDILKSIKVYNFYLNYKFDSDNQLFFGRLLNYKISNINIVDGLLFERNFGLNSLGLVIGSRPDYNDYSINTKLFQYGVYFARKDSLLSGTVENTFSILQQTNNFITDRRFLYFQHSNRIINNLNFFISSEIDLYKKQGNIEKNQLRLTSLFFQTTYLPIREITLNLSYDIRKNIIYYETFKSFIDSVFENETRQGLRFRTTFRLLKNISASVFTNYNYKNKDVNPSKSFGGTIRYFSIPLIKTSIDLSINNLSSSYLTASYFSIYFIKEINQLFSDLSLGYHKTNYSSIRTERKISEHRINVVYNQNLFKKTFITISYDLSIVSSQKTNRILFGITTRL